MVALYARRLRVGELMALGEVEIAWDFHYVWAGRTDKSDGPGRVGTFQGGGLEPTAHHAIFTTAG